MKDCSQALIDSLKSTLSGITVNGKGFFVTEDMPDSNKPIRHIWVKEIRGSDIGTDSTDITDTLINLEIVVSGKSRRGNNEVINDASNQVIELIVHNTLTITGFYNTVNYLENFYNINEGKSNNIITRKIIQISMEVVQNGS